jgi:hypothetical protein
MPRTKDPTKRYPIGKAAERAMSKADTTLQEMNDNTGVGTDVFMVKTLRSKLDSNQRYENNNTDSVRVRVRKGTREQLLEYVKNSEEYSSLNQMIQQLLMEKTGIDCTTGQNELKEGQKKNQKRDIDN